MRREVPGRYRLAPAHLMASVEGWLRHTAALRLRRKKPDVPLEVRCKHLRYYSCTTARHGGISAAAARDGPPIFYR